MAESKVEYSATDAKSIVLYGLTTPSSTTAIPLLVDSTGKLKVSGLSDYAKLAISITSANFFTAITNSTLVAGQWYLITDYQTVDYIRQSVDSLGYREFYTAPVEQIYVQADSPNTVKYEGWSKTYVGEKIGYVADRTDYTASPAITYNPDDGSTGTVTVTPLDQDTLEITTNPFPSDPDDATDFSLYAYDNTYGVEDTFDSTNKGVKWEFDSNGDFALLVNSYPFNQSFDFYWSGGVDGGGTQTINVVDEVTIEATTPDTTMVDWIFNSAIGGYWYIADDNIGFYAYYDFVNKDQTWKINASGEFEILDRGSDTSTYIDDYSTQLDFTSSTTFDVLTVSNFNVTKGSSNNGTTNLYIEFSDATSINLDYSNYGTLWTSSGLTITVIGDSHDLTSDVVYVEGTIFGTDQTVLIDLTISDMYLEGNSYRPITVPIDLTNSSIEGGWSYTVQALGGIIVNRTIVEKNHSIDFDFRGTKFRRYKPLATAWDSGTVYTAGETVSRSNHIFVKILSDGLMVDPTSSGGYYVWGMMAYSSADKYFMVATNFSINSYDGTSLTMPYDSASYVDTDFLGQSGANLFTMTAFEARTGWVIKNYLGSYEVDSGVDIVITTTTNDNFTIKLSVPMTAKTVSYSDLLIQGAATYCLNDLSYSKGTINNCLIYTAQRCNFNLITRCILNNWANNIVEGTLTDIFSSVHSGVFTTSNYSKFIGNSKQTFFGYSVYSNLYINILEDNYFPGSFYNNSINSIKKTTIGTTFYNNKIYGTIYEAYVSGTINNTEIWSIFGSSSNFAGNFTNITGSIFKDVVSASTNTDVGAGKYNDFSTITSCVFNGAVQGNYLPLVDLNKLTVGGNFTQCSRADVANGQYDYVASTTVGKDMYKVKFTGKARLADTKFSGSFQNSWFGSGTFASPTYNADTKSFLLNTILGDVNNVNVINGIVTGNLWLGAIKPYGALYATFNMGSAGTVSTNVFGTEFSGNTFTANFLKNYVGNYFAGNTISAIQDSCNIGNYCTVNTFGNANTSSIVNDGVSSATIPAIGLGVSYPSLLIKGSADGGATNILDLKNLSGLQLFLCNNSGQFSIGNTSPQGQLTVYRNTATPGTVSNSAGGTTVTGVRTGFRNTFKIGDSVTIGGQTVAVATISNDTSMTVTPAVTNANTAVVYTTTGIPVLVAYAHGKTGIGRVSPQKALDVNAVDGECLRLVYNDDVGSAADANYVDFSVSSSGDLTVNASGGDVTFIGAVKTGGRYRAVTTKTTTYTVTKNDEVVVCDSATPFTVTLLAATGSGQTYAIKNINTGAVTIEGASSDTIDGDLNQLVYEDECIQLVDYAANAWVII